MNEEVLKRLDLLAAKLQTTGEHLWQVLVLHAKQEATMDVVFGVLLICGGLWLLRWIRNHEDLGGDIVFFGGFGVLIPTIIGVLLLREGILSLLNPEYAALHQLVGAMR